jgi:hypothetical protein
MVASRVAGLVVWAASGDGLLVSECFARSGVIQHQFEALWLVGPGRVSCFVVVVCVSV